MPVARPAAVGIVLCASVLLALPGAEPRAEPKPSAEQIARWVRQLGDNAFSAREEASRELWRAGEPAEAALEKAAASDDAEVARRSQEILNKFRWGHYPTTPEAIVGLIGRYRAAEATDQLAVVGELLDEGRVGCKTLLKILAAEKDTAKRTEVLNRLATDLSRAVPWLLQEKEFALFEALLQAGLEGRSRHAVNNLVAYWLFTGQLEKKIEQYQAKAARGDSGKDDAELLVALYRAKGDLAGARAVAQRAERHGLVYAMLYDVGDWKEDSWPAEASDGTRKVEKLGYVMACQRLAGKTREFEQSVAEVCRLAEAVTPDDERELFPLAKVLFLNNRPKEALKILGKSDAQVETVCQVLATQSRYTEALALAEKTCQALARFEGPAEKARADGRLQRLELFQAATLAKLGELDRALAIFKRLDAARGMDGGFLMTRQIEAELDAGAVEDAFSHAAEILADGNPRGAPGMFATLFPERGETAQTLWWVVHTLFPADNSGANLKRLRRLMAGEVGRDEFGRWFAALEAALKDLDRDGLWLAVAEAALDSRVYDVAGKCLVKVAGAESLVRQGDVAAAQKEWRQAARLYYQAWEKDRRQPLALYLSGKSLIRGGEEKEGRLRVERSHWLPLGDTILRYSFARALGARGHTADMCRECDWIWRLGDPGSVYVGNAFRRLAIDASRRRETTVAADYFTRTRLGLLPRGPAFWPGPRYLVLDPATVCTYQVGALLAAGKNDEAFRLIAAGQEVNPGSTPLAVLIVPLLEKRGLKKEADLLFNSTIKVYEDVCREYPRCSTAHNSLAWVSAGCRRNPDAALKHALRSVELTPNRAWAIDTLAEVYFQRGDKAKAIETERRAIAAEPVAPLIYVRQLKRLQAGDPAVPTLSELRMRDGKQLLLHDDED